MAKDHFIPVSLIARFAEDDGDPARTRKVWTLRGNGHRAEVRAESIGYTNNLYDVDGEMFPTRGIRAVDQTWSAYEGNLSGALDRLIGGTTTAEEWINTLVPFVAASFARDRGYRHRVVSRIDKRLAEEMRIAYPELAELVVDDTNVAINRVIEMERFAARALASEWTVYAFDEDVVLSDLGYGFDLVSEDPDVVALFLPIGKRHVLSLTPRPVHQILKPTAKGWSPCIAHSQGHATAQVLNRELAKAAQDFVAGTRSAIDGVMPEELGIFDWDAIDEILSLWPFNVDTRRLIGLYRVVRDLVRKNIDSLEGVHLDRYQAIAELEPQAALVAPHERVHADEFLSVDRDSGLVLTVHFPFCRSPQG